MNSEFEKQAKSIADSSGFPLQIKLANIAESSSSWRVFLEEHPWKSGDMKSEGFLDIVLIKNGIIMVIECKRVRETKWAFLIPDPNPSQRYYARLWESRYTEGKWNKFNWVDWPADPSSFESNFCAITGSQNILERTAAQLIQATEAFAMQEQVLNINEQKKVGEPFTFHRLYISGNCYYSRIGHFAFRSRSISPQDGSLPPDSTFVSVPVVRFRKSLSTDLPFQA